MSRCNGKDAPCLIHGSSCVFILIRRCLKNENQRAGHFLYLIIALYFILTFHERYATSQVENMTYSEFKESLAAKNINEITISGDQVSGSFKKE